MIPSSLLGLLPILFVALVWAATKITFREKALKNSHENQFLNSHRSNNGCNKFYGFWVSR